MKKNLIANIGAIALYMASAAPAGGELPADYKTWRKTESSNGLIITYRKGEGPNGKVVREHVKIINMKTEEGNLTEIIRYHVIVYGNGLAPLPENTPLELHLKIVYSQEAIDPEFLRSLEQRSINDCRSCHPLRK